MDQLDDVEFLIFPSQLLLQQRTASGDINVGRSVVESEQALHCVEELNLSLGDDGEDLGDGQTSVKLRSCKGSQSSIISPSNAKSM